jgi:putative pyruvate formate lyase activating enzyme
MMLDGKLAGQNSRYLAVAQDEKPAKFSLARMLPADFSEDEPTRKLWQMHESITHEFYGFEGRTDAAREGFEDIVEPVKSYLDLKIAIADRILHCCHFCTRRCGIDRFKGDRGYCKCGTEIAVSSIFVHMGEEPELVPSGTIFTMGCTIRCKHCQNWTISQWMENGEVYKPQELAKEVEKLRVNGCRNANLVGGEPTPWLQQWLETFKHVRTNIPIVWNSNSYYSPETAQLLAGFADVYLLDLKYGPDECSERISDAPDYWKVSTRNCLEAKQYGELIIRVLVLPNHIECCTKPIINWIAKNLGRNTRVNIMFQYRPEWQACENPELCRRLTTDEIEHAVRLAKEARLENLIT